MPHSLEVDRDFGMANPKHIEIVAARAAVVVSKCFLGKQSE